MVSSSLNMSAEEVLEVLVRLHQEEADDPEYQALRSHLPADWPI
jgi:hypothetical protein